MKKSNLGLSRSPRLTPVAAALASTFALSVPAFAQEAKDTNAGLEKVVVTATSQAKSKMRSSVSVTDIDQETIKDLAPRTEAEVLLLIPGIRTDTTAGPGGNANISVRGLPITSGGSKYVQLQEDGLPTVQFGDMNFGNNDYWIRFDSNVDSVQTLRGGSSAVFASHAPGAVINYISKTGKQTGGSIGVSRGLNFNETRFDGEYGGKLASDLYYHVGGYYRFGESTRHYGSDNALEGYQIKGNITKEFNKGKGFFRVYFKALDEHAPTTPQTFLYATKTGNTIGGFAKVPGYDGTRDSQYSIYNATMTSVNPATGGIYTSSLLDGITVNAKALGFEFQNELADGWTINNKFRKTSQSGAFQTQFWDVQTLDKLFAGNPGATTAKYYNGPGAGTVVTNANLLVRDREGKGLVQQGAAINTQLGDMGNVVNDLSVSKSFKTDGMTIDAKAGLYHMVQNVQQVWSISNRVTEVGKDGRIIDLFGANGAALTTAGLTGYNNQWGACCARNIDGKFTTDAPYLGLNLAAGQLDIDGGVRRETFKSNATYAGSKKLANGLDVNQDGVISGAETNVFVADNANPGLSNYKISYTNSSLGANYRLTNDLSVFARTSKGYRAISDRLLFSANIDAVTGALLNSTAALAPVKQNEIGFRSRGKEAWGSYGTSITYFRSTTTEFDYDQTRQDNPNLPNYQGPKLNVFGFKSSGLEVEAGANFGIFSLNGNVTYSKATKTADLGNPGTVGKESDGVPKLRYNIIPRVTLGDVTVGGVIRGQSSVWQDGNNTVKIGGHQVMNLFVNYDFGGGWVGALQVNNLFDKVFPSGGGGFVNGSTSVFGTGPELGRTINASVKYTF